MEGSWIKVCSRWPYNCVHFRINPHLRKKERIAKWPKYLTFQNLFEIDGARQAVIKLEIQCVWGAILNGCDAVNWMVHSRWFTVTE